MRKPKVFILAGYGLNCEEETAFSFSLVGAKVDIMHINDLISNPVKLKRYQILAIPGGFSYGDDTGSGRAFANKIKNHLLPDINKFVNSDKLIIGICNGFQILVNLELLPGALVHNDTARYIDRWVDLKIDSKSPWLSGIRNISMPIAHGEGKYYLPKSELDQLKKNKMVALRYKKGEICKHHFYSANPNGSIYNIAGISSKNGRILGIMPHPERAIFFTQLPHWPYLKQKYIRKGKEIPKFGPGLQIFKNAVECFK